MNFEMTAFSKWKPNGNQMENKWKPNGNQMETKSIKSILLVIYYHCKTALLHIRAKHIQLVIEFTKTGDRR